MSLHKYDEKIVTLDGIKRINELTIGDYLPSPTGYKKIINISEFNGEVFELKTKNNQSIYSSKKGRIFLESTTTKKSEKSYKDNFIISILEYLSKSKTFKNIYKIRSSCFEFKESKVSVDPYFVGILLGDGHIGRSIGVTSIDQEIINEIYRQAEKYKLNIRIENGGGKRCNSYFFTKGNHNNNENKLISLTNSLGIRGLTCGDKFIPDCYKLNDKEIRLSVLAGLIDTDGSKSDSVFDFISKSKALSEDVCFLSRSLGLRATIKESIKKSQNGTKGIYHRVTISGNTDIVPVRLARKACDKRKQKKNPNRFGFDVFRSEEKNFYDVSVEEDGTYLNYEFLICAS